MNQPAALYKSAGGWGSFFRRLIRFGGNIGKYADRGLAKAENIAARRAASAAAKAPRIMHSVPVEQAVDRTLPKLLKEIGIGRLTGKSGREISRTIRKLPPEVRKAISQVYGQDLASITSEMSRLGSLRKGVTNQETLNAIQSRLKYLGARREHLANMAPYYKQTGWNRIGRTLGLGMGLGFGGMEANEAYKKYKEGDYVNAAYHAAMAPLYGLGSSAGVIGRGLKAFGRANKIRGITAAGRGLAALGRPFEMMEMAGKYGTSGNKITRWMMRHPILTAEAIGTPLGADTMLNGFRKGNEMPDDDIAGYFHGLPLSNSEAMKLQNMDNNQLAGWLKENGYV